MSNLPSLKSLAATLLLSSATLPCLAGTHTGNGRSTEDGGQRAKECEWAATRPAALAKGTSTGNG